jgi:hypothetical protein
MINSETNKVNHLFNMSRSEEYSHNLRPAGQTHLHRYMVESPAVSLIPITINNVRSTKLVMPLIRLSLLQVYRPHAGRLNDSRSDSGCKIFAMLIYVILI